MQKRMIGSETFSVIGLVDVGSPIKISSKVAPNASGFRAEQIRKACLGSLERLGIDWLDMYLLHWPAW
ncbi:MAG: aldo/keto reductase [Actinomycetota bacterium]